VDDSVFHAMLWSQFGAAILMLENAILGCPDELWAARSRARPFWRLAYHSLFFLDLYLSDTPSGFAPPPPFTLSELSPGSETPETPYSKTDLRGYLDHGRRKCRAAIEALTAEKLLRPCGFRWVGVNVAELFLYNMRHVQHHAAQLNLILREKTDSAPSWVFKAERDTKGA